MLLRLAENRQSTHQKVANTSFAHDTRAPNALARAARNRRPSPRQGAPHRLARPSCPRPPRACGPRATRRMRARAARRQMHGHGERNGGWERPDRGGGRWRQRAWGPGLWVTVGLRLIPRPRPGSHSWAWSQDRTGQGRHRNGKRGLPAAGNLPGGRKGPHRAGSAPWTGGARASSSPLFKGKDGAMQIDAVERRLARFNRRRIYFEIAEAG